MDFQDAGVTWDNVVLATETLVPYVLEWRPGSEEDGEAECVVLVLMKRAGGVLLAMPVHFLPEDLIFQGNSGQDDVVFGPSFQARVPASILEGGVISPTGMEVDVLVIDCMAQVLDSMRLFGPDEEVVYNFDEDSPFAFPLADALLPQVLQWAGQSADARAGFYTPVEEEEQVETPARRPKDRRVKASPLEDGAKPKRPTTASLAQDMRGLMEPLPLISSQLQVISDRQTALEARLPAATRTPPTSLSSALGVHRSATAPNLSQLARGVHPPPRTVRKEGLGLLASPGGLKPAELQALEEEKQEILHSSAQTSGDVMLAKAVMEQSRALTSLVSQIASAQSDPMSELTGGSSSAGTRGATTRAKLQLELAQHRGSFFNSVLQSMSRRMAPTSPASSSAEELLARGVSGVRYLERFGGYGRHRELGQLQYQVMSIFDFLMADNVPAAMDGVALLAVTLEQSCLDGGRMELATLLCLQEDPPASIFVNRQIAATSRARSFAPLADQRWITCALAFLKELEIITAKRTELTGGKAASENSSDNPGSSSKPKAKAARKKGRGKGSTEKSEEADG